MENWNINVFVSDEKTARRKPFLQTENELQTGFRASFIADEPIKLKFSSIEIAIDDLLYQLQSFLLVFKRDKIEQWSSFFWRIKFRRMEKVSSKTFYTSF